MIRVKLTKPLQGEYGKIIPSGAILRFSEFSVLPPGWIDSGIGGRGIVYRDHLDNWKEHHYTMSADFEWDGVGELLPGEPEQGIGEIS